ncbi:E3 ubiquitin-protein ligase mib1 [Pestalotiopsis sp. IQ-011]
MSRPPNLSKITINGEEYWPTPHEVNPDIPEDQLYLSDTEWYDAIGQDLIAQRRIWAIPSESGQVAAFEKLLADVPHRALDIMWAAALKGRPHVIRFLLGRGVKAMPVDADGDDVTLVPFHVAAAKGHLDCVKIFVEEVRLPTDNLDDLGGTPLMRVCFKGQPEVVRYLLGKDADLTIRQTASPDDDPGTSVFEFAAGGNSIACTKALLSRAQELGIDPCSLATPLALEAAVQSEEVEMLDLMLELGKYPAVNRQWSDEQHDVSLTGSMKEAIESAFSRALKAE